MNILKFKKFMLVALIIQLWGNPIKAVAINAPVETYFLPQDVEALYEKLYALLDNAKQQILVAMYLLTDEKIINKLISLKKNGIDVQIIFDETSNDYLSIDKLMELLKANKIIPFIKPSKTMSDAKLMHNKFLVIDERIVLSGSANFTKTAIDPSYRTFNNENIIVIHSNEIANKYTNAFFDMKKNIAVSYINLLANNLPYQLPNWLRDISLMLYQHDEIFVDLYRDRFFKFDETQQDRLMNFFPEISGTEIWEPAAIPAQRAFLEARGLYREGMSKQEATESIEQLKQIATATPPTQEHQIWKPATFAQKKFLEARGIPTHGMSKQQAIELIGSIKRGERRPY